MERSGFILKIIKISMGSLIAMVIAQELGLKYGSSAGVITLLSIRDTKRETIRVTARRILAFMAALVLGPVSFGLAGYRPLAIGLFLLLFTPVCIRWGIQEGISVNTVLMTHFLAEQSMGAGNVVNEALLLLIGTGVGVALNLYIPGSGTAIRRAQREIEEKFIGLLQQIADELEGPENRRMGGDICRERLERLEQALEAGERRAYEGMENSLLSDTRYYLAYMSLRKSQYGILCRIWDCIRRMESLPPQASMVSILLCSISRSFHEENNALALLDELDSLKSNMRDQPLPARREEFESRALLYLALLETEQFLVMKREFAEGMSREEARRFWGMRRP